MIYLITIVSLVNNKRIVKTSGEVVILKQNEELFLIGDDKSLNKLQNDDEINIKGVNIT